MLQNHVNSFCETEKQCELMLNEARARVCVLQPRMHCELSVCADGEQERNINIVSYCGCCKLNTWKYEPIEKQFKHKLKAGGVLMCNKKILIIQSRGGMWGFPKGSIEKNESISDCAMREIREETSIHINILPNDNNVKINDIFLYIIELDEFPIINFNNIFSLKENDCSGIGWININCLQKIIQAQRKRTERLYFPRVYTVAGGVCKNDTQETAAGEGVCVERKHILTNAVFNSALKKFVNRLN